MILQALNEYYNRKAATDNNTIAPEGWEWKEIPYRIVINMDGKFVAIEDTREGEGKKMRSKKFLVPQSVKRTVGKSANLLWDNIEYALGANPRNRTDVEERFGLFLEKIKAEININESPSVKSLMIFLQDDPVDQIEKSSYNDLWKIMLDENPFIVFKIDEFAHSCICDDVRTKINRIKSDNPSGVCLITGEANSSISRLHPNIKGVRGGNTQGGALVSFNLAAFNSYGRTQNFNAPISEKAAFGYTTALNSLLGKDSNNKVTIADTTIVFWSEKRSTSVNPEEIFSWVVAAQKTQEDNPDAGSEKILKLIESIHTGQLSSEHSNHFYLLGLAPNSARISVRFWRSPSVEDFGKNIKTHFDDFEIIHGPNEKRYLSLYQILSSTALGYKMDNVPPNLAGAVIESIVDGTPYPRALLQQCMIRIRAERSVNRTRAAIVKAFFNRYNKFNNKQKELLMALDPQNTNISYRTGRLFAVLEKIQEESSPGINATIRDRFYSAASSTPVTVFPRLLSLKNAHIKKLSDGKKVFFEKLIGEIIEGINLFPSNLSLNEQAYFAIGYYHQRQDFFTPKNDKSKNETETNNQ